MSFRFLILASLATAGLVFATTPSAAGYGGHRYQSGSYCKLHGGYHNNRNYSYSYDYRYRPKGYGYKNHHGYNSHRGSSHSYGGSYVNRGRTGHYSGGCRSVYRIDYWNGHKARIGGTECYDHYGKPYIVPGSRHVIEYLYY